MYSHILAVTCVPGKGADPTIAASWGLGCLGAMKAALGARFAAGAAVLAVEVFAGAAFFAGAVFLAGVAFFAVAI